MQKFYPNNVHTDHQSVLLIESRENLSQRAKNNSRGMQSLSQNSIKLEDNSGSSQGHAIKRNSSSSPRSDVCAPPVSSDTSQDSCTENRNIELSLTTQHKITKYQVIFEGALFVTQLSEPTLFGLTANV